MRSSNLILAMAWLGMTVCAQAHVRVLPFESQPGAHQKYTVKVPTEGAVTTTSVELEVPEGVSVVSIADPADTKKTNGRTTSITWKVEIPAGQSRDLIFEAINPAGNGDLSWKAHQHYADGTSRDWVGLPKTKSPASITKLTAGPNP